MLIDGQYANMLKINFRQRAPSVSNIFNAKLYSNFFLAILLTETLNLNYLGKGKVNLNLMTGCEPLIRVRWTMHLAIEIVSAWIVIMMAKKNLVVINLTEPLVTWVSECKCSSCKCSVRKVGELYDNWIQTAPHYSINLHHLLFTREIIILQKGNEEDVDDGEKCLQQQNNYYTIKLALLRRLRHHYIPWSSLHCFV